MTDILRSFGEVDLDASYFRDTEYVVHFFVRTGLTCPRCGSGEVWQPGQTMDMPMIDACLRCGLHAPVSDFDEVGR